MPQSLANVLIHIVYSTKGRRRWLTDAALRSELFRYNAAILRDNELIVPHGNTVLRTDDRVTVVGAAADFSLIVRTFTAGAARFPLDFGKRVAVILDSRADLDGPVGEAINLTRNTVTNTRSLHMTWRNASLATHPWIDEAVRRVFPDA